MRFKAFSKHVVARTAFSLVEVVVAVGIFAIAVISVIGLLGPINQSVANVKDGDDATRVISIVQSELQRLGIVQVNSFRGAGTLLYANRDGSKIGTNVATAPWNVDVPELDGVAGSSALEINAQKFFQISLLRNDDLPFDALNGFLALNIVLRWPAFTGDGNELTGDAIEQQSILIVPVAITR